MRLKNNKGNKREDILQEHHTLGVKRESIWKALTFGKGKHKKEGIKIVVVIMVVVMVKKAEVLSKILSISEGTFDMVRRQIPCRQNIR